LQGRQPASLVGKRLGYLSGNKLSALVHDTYDAISDAGTEAWDFIANDPRRTISNGIRDWVFVNLLAIGIKPCG